MPRTHKYSCSVCGKVVGRSRLRVKQAAFKEMGKGGALVRTRTTAWLCTPGCLEIDPDWSRPAFLTSPGMADTTPAREHREATDAR